MFEPVPRRLLVDEAHHRLRTAIVDGGIPPGAALRDVELAERLGLSRAPVREALKRLVAEGLVVTKPQSFTRVAALDARSARDACAVVGAMHELATRLAVPHLVPDDVAAMASANDRFARAVHTGDVDAALEADDALHGVLVSVAGNAAVEATIDRYTPLVRRLERLQFGAVTAQDSVSLHAQLIAACRAGDATAAADVTGEIFSGLARHLAPPPDPS